jgi:glucokinase
VRAHSVIGVDVGGTKILAGVVDRDGTVLVRRSRPTPLESAEELVEALADEIGRLLAGDGAPAAVGVGVPSRVDQRTGEAVASTHVPLAGIRLRDRLAARFGVPVVVDNDGTAAAIAEWALGAGRGTRDLVMLTLGTGIGGGLILDGRPYRGATGCGAELGHMVIEFDGPACQGTCSGRGHLEAFVSGGAADRVARSLFGPEATASDLLSRARAGDGRAGAAVREMGRRLGAGVASLVNVFEPEIVVIGGGFGAGCDLLLPPARKVVARDAIEPARDRVRIEPAALGEDAGLVGAAQLAFGAVEAAGGA